MQIKLKYHSLLILCLIIFSICMLGNYNVKADSGPGISIAPDYPKEQIQKSGIFNVRFTPNKHYNLTLKVANTSNENKTVTISPNTAYTSNSGGIAFDKSNTINPSKGYNFRSLFDQKNQKITIPAKSVGKVTFGLKMPLKLYKGVIVGGFYITIPNNSKSNIKNNFTIKNHFSYGIAAVIHDNKEKAQPKIQLGDITTNNSNDQMQVKSNLRNVNPGIISGMNVKSEIVKSNSNKIVSKSNRNDLSMAPNSSFDYLDVIENSLSPGEYKVKLNITDVGGHTWQESKNFKINTKEYVTHFTKKVPSTLYILIGTIIFLLLIIISLFYYLLKHKNKN